MVCRYKLIPEKKATKNVLQTFFNSQEPWQDVIYS